MFYKAFLASSSTRKRNSVFDAEKMRRERSGSAAGCALVCAQRRLWRSGGGRAETPLLSNPEQSSHIHLSPNSPSPSEPHEIGLYADSLQCALIITHTASEHHCSTHITHTHTILLICFSTAYGTNILFVETRFSNLW